MVRDQKGFSLIEVIIVLLLLVIVSIVVAPKVQNLMQNMQIGIAYGIAGDVQGAIQTYYADKIVESGFGFYPAELDMQASNLCSGGCFNFVLEQPLISNEWEKIGNLNYRHRPSKILFTYDPVDGSFD